MTPLTIDGSALTIEDVGAAAHLHRAVVLSERPSFIARLDAGAALVAKLLREQGSIYGVTTGFGDSVSVAVPTALAGELSRQLYTYHGVGLGRVLSPEETRAVLMARLQSLAQGVSGVRAQLLRSLAGLLQHDVLPLIPEEGSVGASGDLTPLSYVAAVLCGERAVWHAAHIRPAAEALAAVGQAPLLLEPKEGLALMNGTAVMTGLGCLAFLRAASLAPLCAHLTAMVSLTTTGNPAHFDEGLFALKPHLGQQRVARWVRQALGTPPASASRLQDRYSLRCAPHVIGVLEDALPWLRQLLENELNSANDNPLVDVERGEVLHGGHFYGGHVCLAMDTLKTAVANLADLMDRQLALLVDPRFSHGLPANLSGATGERAPLNHGLKAVHIAASAWTAEALKLTMPASVFSRSTESHNQDKVSLGTIAARDAMRILTLTEQVAAALTLSCRQALFLRHREGLPLPASAIAWSERLGIEPLREDRQLDTDLQRLGERLRRGLALTA